MAGTEREAPARRRLLLAPLAVALALLAGCGRREASCGGVESFVACVDGVALTQPLVASFVEETWWEPGSPELPDPRRRAVARAIRSQLFAAEARRRGLTPAPGAPDSMVSRAQALIAEETRARGILRDAIPDADALRHYEQNKELFNQIDLLDTQVIVFDSPATAARVYPEAAAADTEAFRALVARHSIDATSKENGGNRKVIASTSEDRELLKMALSLRKPGAVGGPFKASDGRWYILRILSSPIEHPRAADEELLTTVKNAMVDERRRAMLDELERGLKAKASVRIVESSLLGIKTAAHP